MTPKALMIIRGIMLGTGLFIGLCPQVFYDIVTAACGIPRIIVSDKIQTAVKETTDNLIRHLEN